MEQDKRAHDASQKIMDECRSACRQLILLVDELGAVADWWRGDYPPDADLDDIGDRILPQMNALLVEISFLVEGDLAQIADIAVGWAIEAASEIHHGGDRYSYRHAEAIRKALQKAHRDYVMRVVEKGGSVSIKTDSPAELSALLKRLSREISSKGTSLGDGQRGR